MRKKINTFHSPQYHDSGFGFTSVEQMKKAFEEEQQHPHEPEHYIYSRYRNPVIVDAEKELAELENSAWSILSESGMAAIDLALSLFQRGKETRPWLFFSELYGGTNSYIELVLRKKRGIDAITFQSVNDTYDLQAFDQTLKETKPEVIYFESVSNPMLIVADAKKIMEIAKKHHCKIVVDNTFLTPQLWKPLSDGADLVIHSVTKYLAGHGNLTAGAIMGNDAQYLKELIEIRKWTGHMLSPADAHRLLSFLKTFQLRFSKQCENAWEIAHFLHKHDGIEKVHYPGLKSHETHTNALKLTNNAGFGAMITFDIAGKDQEEKAKKCQHFIDKVREKIHIIPSLGDADSILLPVEAVWGAKYPYPGMIRLSVGIEDTEALMECIREGLG
jgi:cystathionine beta-lyase/cystathionine gamma-synthase